MAVIDGTALGEEALAAALVAAEEPVVIRPVPHSWAAPPLERLVRDHGELPLSVTLSGGRFIGDEAESAPSSLGRYSLELASGQLPADAYVFDELGGVDLSSGEFALGGTGVAPAARDLSADVPSLSFFRTVLARHSEERPSTAGRLLLSAGGWANGRPFHAHGPALFALLGGAKRWLVRRPNASFAWQSLEAPRESLSGASLPDGWEPHVWQCTQREGELLWVPDQQHHATLNYAAETVGVTMVIDETEPFTPLHAAAQSGAAAAVARLLRDGAEVDAVAVASGATPLHFAAGLGHCDALEALLGGGATVDAVASGGNTPLHVAAAGGHARAVRMLVQSGADLEARDAHGHTAHGLAVRLGQEEAAAVLERAAVL
eukprot:CAMPEP_0202800246 /NCGR_PEP_ID=MMETSP1388-20130828/100102_1 /ASSEMBLY_ACC=CAM_ASM_000864 /TAXON_ID=37098 /ORGANISM="Isochrysis sp, Strain CCMP1244" /LENGTH=375 /DNA_ID=CAMNT_0049470227 /DNA_START=197 /DNA_END=1324 /DNA_ORIENTATION=+